VGKVLELLVEGSDDGMAITLYREGRRTFDRARWQAFLGTANNLMRASNRRSEDASTDSFFVAVDNVRGSDVSAPVEEILGLLASAKPRVDSLRAHLLDGQKSALDPLIPAVGRAIAHWGDDRIPVSIVHDRQNALSEDLVTQLKKTSAAGVLADLTLVDSRADARIQVADVLAGAARKIASDELNSRGDAELTALLRPFVDRFSVWGDDRSWSALAPPGNP
jgi:hypothetical protein